MTSILISAGDYSADIHGESLVKEMREIDPSLSVTALGGVRLKSVANEFLRDMVEMDVSGFSQPFKQFFSLKSILQNMIFPRLESRQVEAVILIDYYGFNIHVAEKAWKEKIPVFYFVSPQVWASRRWRIQRLKKFVTKMLVIFPFEEQLYKENGVQVEFVGHPIMDTIAGLKEGEPDQRPEGAIHLGLMPGSRQRELDRHLPLMIKSFEILKKKFPSMEASLFAVDSIGDEAYRPFIGSGPIALVREKGYQKRLGLTLCLAASGTATLENALLGIPMVVIYQASWLTYLIAWLLIQIPYVSMPNILSGKETVPELIQHRAAPERIAGSIERLLSEPGSLEKMRAELIQLREKLGKPGAYSRAAKIILEAIPNSA